MAQAIGVKICVIVLPLASQLAFLNLPRTQDEQGSSI